MLNSKEFKLFKHSSVPHLLTERKVTLSLGPLAWRFLLSGPHLSICIYQGAGREILVGIFLHASVGSDSPHSAHFNIYCTGQNLGLPWWFRQ